MSSSFQKFICMFCPIVPVHDLDPKRKQSLCHYPSAKGKTLGCIFLISSWKITAFKSGISLCVLIVLWRCLSLRWKLIFRIHSLFFRLRSPGFTTLVLALSKIGRQLAKGNQALYYLLIILIIILPKMQPNRIFDMPKKIIIRMPKSYQLKFF